MATAEVIRRFGVRPSGAADALELARNLHCGQVRPQGGGDFIDHPIAVAALISGAGFPEEAIAAAYLHDAVEKTPVGIDEIERRFGAGVSGLVAALTQDPAIDGYSRRKRELRHRALAAGRTAVALYAADRLANVREWLPANPSAREAIAVRLGTTMAERIELWVDDLRELNQLRPQLPFVAEFELALRTIRAEHTSDRGSGPAAADLGEHDDPEHYP